VICQTLPSADNNRGVIILAKYLFEEVKRRLSKMVDIGLEPELSFSLRGEEYMIIAFKDKCSFQRYTYGRGSGEIYYATIDDLYNSVTIDGVLLSRDWEKLTNFVCVDYEWEYGVSF